MDEERICSICEEPIDGDDYETLDNGDIVCHTCASECCRKCENCEGLFQEDELIEEDDKYYCEYCHDQLFAECEMCGATVLEDDMKFWGDCRVCPDCYEAQCPSFDEDENQEETTEGYEAMLKKFVGRKSRKEKGTTVDLTYEIGDEAPCSYEMSVTLDEEGRIIDISRLSGSMLMSEGERSSDWRPLAIDNDDYEWIAESMLEDLDLEDEDEDEEDFEEEDEEV